MYTQVRQAIAELEAFIATVDDAMNVPRPAGAFMYGLVLATRAKRAVEIGTSYGYSGLWIASALAENGGRLTTIDRDPRKTEAAEARFVSAGLGSVVECRTGIALTVLPGLRGPIDFVLSDADKANCTRYVEMLLPELADRAVVLTDNTRTHPADLAPFLAWIRAHPGFYSTEVPVGNGMELAVWRAGSESG
jgi:predicted O-methyltransferase YrrM